MTQIQHNENSYLMVQKEQMQLNRSERYSSPIRLLLLLTAVVCRRAGDVRPLLSTTGERHFAHAPAFADR